MYYIRSFFTSAREVKDGEEEEGLLSESKVSKEELRALSRKCPDVPRKIIEQLMNGADPGLLMERILSGEKRPALDLRHEAFRMDLLRLICTTDRVELLEQMMESPHVFVLPDEIIYRSRVRAVSLLEFCALTPYAPNCLAYLVFRERFAVALCRISPCYLDELLGLYKRNFPEKYNEYKRAYAKRTLPFGRARP